MCIRAVPVRHVIAVRRVVGRDRRKERGFSQALVPDGVVAGAGVTIPG